MYKLGLLLLIGIAAAEIQQLRGDGEHLERKKRQIPEPNLPTFGPDVERTADGVPILDESYLARKDRPAARFFAQFEPEKEGLRLYESLLDRASGGRPELRSLDGEDPFGGENGLQSSHSGSWTRKTHSRRTSRKSIQVKSANGGTSAADLPSGFGPSTGPQFSEEVNYQRTTNANKLRRNSQLRSLDSNGNNGYSCTTCRRQLGSHELPGATELKTLTRSTTTNANGHETQGLRLYKNLLRNGGSTRNQLRSLDTSSDDHLSQNGILPHHRQSAAWSQKEEKHESYSRNHSSVQVKSSGSADDIPSGFGASSGPQFSDETTYRRSNSGRRASSRSASQTRSLSSSSDQTTSTAQNNGNGYSCVRCRTQTSTSSLDESPVTYHRSSRVPSTGDYLIPTTPASSHSWAEREERSHSSSRTVSRTINGVETNGLGEPLVSAEEATYRRVASGGNNGNSGSTSARNLRTGARTHHSSSADHSSASRTHASSSDSSNTHTAARTLSVAGANTNGNGRSARRYNCSRISTTSLSEGAQSVTEIVTPPPCLVRRSDNQLQTRASTRSLNLPYPPVQTFGRGDQEVHARVLESDHENDSAFNHHQSSSAAEHAENENHEESSSSFSEAQPTQTSYRTGRKHKKAYYRRTVFKNYTTSEFPASVETWLGA